LRSIPLTVAGPCGRHTHFPPCPGRLNDACYYSRSTTVRRTFYNVVMSKSSVVTVRETPVAKTTSASIGGLAVIAETIDVDTRDRIELVDLTDTVMAFVRRSGVQEGLLSLWSMHTTCTVFVNESQPALDTDILAFLEDVVGRAKYYKHNDPDHSDCDRQNADSHLRAMLLGHSVTMQISGGELVVGTWQRVLCGEMDGPRTRTIRAQVMGIGS
jgi:secondary thiamine-phosphate synthase enzyme